MENKSEKPIHAQRIANLFRLCQCPKKLSFKKLNTPLHTLNVCLER